MTSKKTVIEVKRKSVETTANMARRFSRKVRQSGILVRAKKNKYRSRPKSALRKKNEAIARIKKREEIAKLKKLGKIQ